MSKLELSDVSFSYGNSTVDNFVLKDINIKFENNKITGIMGHTGSGKSTLIQMFNGLLKPCEGVVSFNGTDIWSKDADIKNVRYKIGLVMQYPEYQLFADTVREDIAYGPRNMGMSEEEIANAIEMAVEFVDLPHECLDRSPFDLSGGQKRRAAIAGIIAMKPEVLVLDEPAAGLDPLGRTDILEKIKKYQRKSGITVIIVSHSMEDIAEFCDNIVIMKNGSVSFGGTTYDAFSNCDILFDAGLDIPEISKLARVLFDTDLSLGQDVYTVDAAYSKLLKIFNSRKNGDII